MRKFFIILAIIVAAIVAALSVANAVGEGVLYDGTANNIYPTTTYTPDRLGDGYLSRSVAQRSAHSGDTRSTIIIKDTIVPSDCGVLYVHGFNDYFFQSQLGDSVIAHGWNFAAVDIRGYGRSLRQGQQMFKARNLNEYFADIDSALVEMNTRGISHIVVMGHSTGGLITSYYMARGAAPAWVDGLILNSPFLDWNLSPIMENIAVPVVSFVGSIFPDITIPQGSSGDYAHSLLASYDGEWNYDTDLKLTQTPDVTAGWIHAINSAQRWLMRHPCRIEVPILLMHSDSVATNDFTRGDAVLDVKDIAQYGQQLGTDVTEVVIPDGLHDLILSRRQARDKAYRAIFNFLGTIRQEETRQAI